MRGIAKRETYLLDGNLCNNSIFNAACDGAVVGRRARRHVAVLLRDHRVREHAGDLAQRRQHGPRRRTKWPFHQARDTGNGKAGVRGARLTCRPVSRARWGVGSTTIERRESNTVIRSRYGLSSAAAGVNVIAPFCEWKICGWMRACAVGVNGFLCLSVQTKKGGAGSPR